MLTIDLYSTAVLSLVNNGVHAPLESWPDLNGPPLSDRLDSNRSVFTIAAPLFLLLSFPKNKTPPPRRGKREVVVETKTQKKQTFLCLVNKSFLPRGQFSTIFPCFKSRLLLKILITSVEEFAIFLATSRSIDIMKHIDRERSRGSAA